MLRRRMAEAIVVAILTVTPAGAAVDGWTGGVIYGWAAPDEELAGANGPSVEPTLGVRAAGPFAGRYGWAADVLFTRIETETFAGDADQWAARAALEIVLGPGRPSPWIVSLGGGYTEIGFDAARDFWSYTASAGIGQRIPAGTRTAYRWELRAERTLADAGLRGKDVLTTQFLFSINWGRKREEATVRAATTRDADGDGIVDELDHCPATARSTPVDEHGCPLDGDRDGVPDSVDDCRDTPAGVGVDARGCHSDRDRDGVPDELDRCPNTIRGVEVGPDGCFLDLDGDGVHDGLGMDKCPGTPAGARVDVHGCPTDEDGDGVWDGLDRCPGTPAGRAVDPEGCPVG